MSDSGVRKHTRAELLDFLRAVDAELARPVELIIIGGMAVSFFDATHATTDLDCFTTRNERWADFLQACNRATAKTGLNVEVHNPGGVPSFPEGYEERLQPAPINGLARLKVLVPERHDLALSKIARGYENDIQAVNDIHQKEPRFAESFDKLSLARRLRDLRVEMRLSQLEVARRAGTYQSAIAGWRVARLCRT